MRIFDDRKRTDTGPSLYSEPIFDYLDRSARPYAERVRALLEEWIDDYPEEERGELVTRFRTDDFDAAFFELFCHALLRALGCEVEVHPELPGGRPDFLAKPKECEPFILEATVARDETEEERGIRKVTEQVLDGINRLRSRDFFLDVQVDRVTGRAPSSAKIRSV